MHRGAQHIAVALSGLFQRPVHGVVGDAAVGFGAAVAAQTAGYGLPAYPEKLRVYALGVQGLFHFLKRVKGAALFVWTAVYKKNFHCAASYKIQRI